YLNLVPFGGNIQGVGAASLIYFGKTPDRATLGEALTLAVIPQRPAHRAGRGAQDDGVLAARSALGRQWLRHNGNTAEARRQIALPIVARRQPDLPWQAPHLVDAMIANRIALHGRLDTTIDSGLQRLVETQIQRHLKRAGDRGIRNAAALLVDARDMSVK